MRANKLITLPILAVLIIASIAGIVPVRAQVPAPEYHYVDGFSADFTGWTAVGTSPYLNAPDDGSYIEGTTDAAYMAWFTFTDVDPSYFTLYAIEHVWLEGYTNGPLNTGVDYDVYNAAFDWLGSLYGNDSPQWVRMRWIAPDDPTDNTDTTLLTESGFNAFKVLLYFYDPGNVGGAGNIIDSLRLYVTFMEKPVPPYPFMSVSPAANIAQVGETFAVNIEIASPPYKPVYDLYGFEFRLAFNPTVIQGVGLIVNGGFFPSNAIEWANVIDNVEGFAWYSLTMPFGAPKGVNGYGVLATITFTMIKADPAITELVLYDTLMGNRYATPIVHGIMNGFAANSANLDLSVSITTAHVETQKWSASGDADGLVGLAAALKNDGAGSTETKARFTIFDESGLLVDVAESEPVLTAPKDTPLLGVNWGGWSLYSSYRVEVTVLYFTADGWVTGMKGSASGSRDVMVVHFRTEA